ncbi:MAG: hypothetical protein SGI99_17120 [Pseudomonadota bacterium]|nr:hypothetical protein [Pseudomonadota bacterium]
MIRAFAFYTNRAGARFDFDYYTQLVGGEREARENARAVSNS